MSTLEPTKRLFVVDFDNTIVNAHFHNLLETKYKTLKKDGGKLKNNQDIADQYTAQDGEDILTQYGIKNPKELAKIFFDILEENGDHIAIVSSSLYPQIIERTLDKLWEIAPLSQKPDLRACIHYTPVAFDALEGWPSKRNAQIKKEMTHFGIINPRDVCLIDDDPKNISLAAGEIQCETIQVPDTPNPLDTTYLCELEALVARKTIEKPEEDNPWAGYGSDTEFTPCLEFSNAMSSLSSDTPTSMPSSRSSSEAPSQSSSPSPRPRSGSSSGSSLSR